MSRETVGSEATGPNTSGCGPQHAHIGQAVPAQRDRECDIQQDLARVVTARCLHHGEGQLISPDPDWSCGWSRSAARTDLRDDPATAALGTDTWVGPDTLLHSRSPTFSAPIWTLDKP
jgi:hypothetical protein